MFRLISETLVPLLFDSVCQEMEDNSRLRIQVMYCQQLYLYYRSIIIMISVDFSVKPWTSIRELIDVITKNITVD